MAISANKLSQDNPVAVERFVFDDAVATSQTNVAFARYRPGYRGMVVGVQANARTVNGYSVPEVRIVPAGTNAGQNVLTAGLTPVAVASLAPAQGVLQTDRALLRFGPTDEIVLHLTSGGTAPVNPRVEISARPFPLNGEA